MVDLDRAKYLNQILSSNRMGKVDIIGIITFLTGVYAVIIFIAFLLYKLTGWKFWFIVGAIVIAIWSAFWWFHTSVITAFLHLGASEHNPDLNNRAEAKETLDQWNIAINSVIVITILSFVVSLYLNGTLGAKPSNVSLTVPVGGRRRR
jgi:hypothetical protein